VSFKRTLSRDGGRDKSGRLGVNYPFLLFKIARLKVKLRQYSSASINVKTGFPDLAIQFIGISRCDGSNMLAVAQPLEKLP
jgi:hypothetical protein